MASVLKICMYDGGATYCVSALPPPWGGTLWIVLCILSSLKACNTWRLCLTALCQCAHSFLCEYSQRHCDSLWREFATHVSQLHTVPVKPPLPAHAPLPPLPPCTVQAMIGRIEEQVGIYQHATASAQQELLFLRGRVEALSKSEESARLEAKTGREELKRARKEWLKMKDDLDGERDAHKQTKVGAGTAV
eukprot:1161956-Pelagomonas_calceolata.AAC.18